MKFIAENETIVLNSIRIFGKFNVDNYNFYNDTTFATEDYICPNIDHELMYKCLNGNNDDNADDDQQHNHHHHHHHQHHNHQTNQQQTSSIEGHQPLKEHHQLQELAYVNFAENKNLINANLNESIVNMTISESKELIDRSNKITNYEELICDGLKINSFKKEKIYKINENNKDDDIKISNLLINNLNEQGIIQEAANHNNYIQMKQESVQQPKEKQMNTKKPKRKIKIRNYNGTINLKNISNLTINTNCNRDTTTSTAAAATTKQSSTKPSMYISNSVPSATSSLSPSSSSKSTSQSSVTTAATTTSTITTNDNNQSDADQNNTTYNCEFYNRLLNEIKHSFTINGGNQQSANQHNNIPSFERMFSTSSSSSTTTTLSSLASLSPAAVPPAGGKGILDNQNPSISSSADNRSCNKMLFKNIRNLKINIPVTNTAATTATKNNQQVSSTTNTSTTSQTRTSTSSEDLSPTNNDLNDELNDDNLLNAPIQIEQWLKQIILETEIEPVQNIEILEHSIINNKNAIATLPAAKI